LTWIARGHRRPHIRTLVSCGEVTPEGEFLEVPELDRDRLQAAWQESAFALYLAEDKIEPEVVENMRTWPHSGFSVDQSSKILRGHRRAAMVGGLWCPAAARAPPAAHGWV